MAERMRYFGMEISIEIVTPDRAIKWLQRNGCNRRLRKKVAEGYARDMVNGNWHAKPYPICFLPNGDLGNGQHTLHGIALSGVTQTLLVARGVPASAIAAMDIGLKRSIADIAHFAEIDIDRRRASIGRVIEYGPGDTDYRTFDEIFDAYTKHMEAIEWTIDNAPKGKSRGVNATVFAVIARAYYTHPAEKLLRFLQTLDNGIAATKEDEAVIRLRDFLRSRSAVAREGRIEAYEKTESALAAFLEGRPMSKIYGSSKELFKIPEATASL